MKGKETDKLMKRESEEIHGLVRTIIMASCQSSEFNAQVAASAIYSVLEDQGVIRKNAKRSQPMTHRYTQSL